MKKKKKKIINKILIVDDDVKMPSYLKNDLQKSYAFDVVRLETALEVLNTLNGSIFDAIILDIMMPIPKGWSQDQERRAESGLSTGLILYEQIRMAYPLLPIVIYSAKNITVKDKHTCILRKPELTSEIVEQLYKLMENEE